MRWFQNFCILQNLLLVVICYRWKQVVSMLYRRNDLLCYPWLLFKMYSLTGMCYSYLHRLKLPRRARTKDVNSGHQTNKKTTSNNTIYLRYILGCTIFYWGE